MIEVETIFTKKINNKGNMLKNYIPYPIIRALNYTYLKK